MAAKKLETERQRLRRAEVWIIQQRPVLGEQDLQCIGASAMAAGRANTAC